MLRKPQHLYCRHDRQFMEMQFRQCLSLRKRTTNIKIYFYEAAILFLLDLDYI